MDHSSTTTQMWEHIQNKLTTCVPKYIQNVMESQGFDNIVSIGRMTEEDIDFLESYGKTEKYEKKIPPNSIKADYYGSSVSKEDFEILRGHKKLMAEMIEIVKKTSFLSSKKVSDENQNSTSRNNTSKNGTEELSISGQQNVLNTKTVEWIKSAMQSAEKPQLYAEVLQKMSLNTVHVAFDSTLKSFSAKISCPLCATKVSSVMTSKKLKSGHRSKAIWNISNFQLHIKVHLGPNSKKNQKLASVSDLNSNLKGFLKPKQSSVNSEVNTVRADVSNDAHSSLKCLSETPTTEKTSNSSEQVPTEVPSSDSSSEFQSQESSEVQSPASSEVQSQASILPEQNRSNMTPTLQPQTAAEELSTESQALLEKCTQ